MSRLRLLLLMTFIESFSTTILERAVYFLTKHAPSLNFSDAANLWLALGFGVCYAIGAFVSHGLTQRLGERRIIMSCLWAQAITHAALMAFWRRPDFIFSASMMLGFVNGLKWPVVETYVSSGLAPKATARAIGFFNMSWAGAVPLALIVAGPLIGSDNPTLLFLLPMTINLTALLLCLPLPQRPVHLAETDPDRPTPEMLTYLQALLTGNRWLMLGSYASMWVLAALLPDIFRRLGTGVESAAGMSGVIDIVRFAAFILLQFVAGWHYRVRYVLAAMIGLPLGFFMVLFAPNLTVLLIGETIFGVSAGLVYYSSLFYAMVVKNASVEAGGAHEALIGSGFALGPAAGLIGTALGGVVGSNMLGMILGVGPIFLVCSLGGVIPVLTNRKLKASLHSQFAAAEAK